MSEKTASVEEKIIRAAIECIEKYGITGATNRQIALEAGVNNAAINYYFRSKEALIQRCMEITLKNAFDLTEMSSNPSESAQERCISILMDLIAGGYQYPGITRAHFFNLLVEGRYDERLVDWINRFISDLAADLQARSSPIAGEELKLALSQIVSAVLLAILAPDLFERQHGTDPRDPVIRRAYLDRLVSRLLA